MRSTAGAIRIAGLTVMAATIACDPCAGTPSCHGQPEISYTGQFIERFTGAPVANVTVAFVRRDGILMAVDTALAMSDGDGFFTLRAGALADGEVRGILSVHPPEPYFSYSVPLVTLRSSRVRGDGGFFGRLVVNPYLQLLGEIRDLSTNQLVRNAAVTIHVRNAASVMENGTADFSFSTDGGGRFLWEPTPIAFDTLSADIEIVSGRWSRPMRLHRSIPLQYLDGPPQFLPLYVGPSMRHSGLAARRGSGDGVEGITARFVRDSGIRIRPDSFTVAASVDGIFVLQPLPLESGTVWGRLRVNAPGYPVEDYEISMTSSDDDQITYLGQFGYGAAAQLRAILSHRSDGLPIDSGTHVRVSRVAGLPTLTPPLAADSGLRIVDRGGLLSYGAGTDSEGEVVFDLEVRLKAPAKWDTIAGVRVPARFSSAIDTLRFPVGEP